MSPCYKKLNLHKLIMNHQWPSSNYPLLIESFSGENNWSSFWDKFDSFFNQRDDLSNMEKKITCNLLSHCSSYALVSELSNKGND